MKFFELKFQGPEDVNVAKLHVIAHDNSLPVLIALRECFKSGLFRDFDFSESHFDHLDNGDLVKFDADTYDEGFDQHELREGLLIGEVLDFLFEAICKDDFYGFNFWLADEDAADE